MIQPLFEPTAAAELPAWVKEYCLGEGLFVAGDRVLVAVSGGPDSVALLHILHRLQDELGISLGVAHFDHGLRGQESQEDAAFVAHLSRRLRLPYYQGTGDVRTEALKNKLSLQMAARRLRLNFLQEIRRSQGYTKIALGHTADDQVELFFVRLCRGTGPEGLKGMWPAGPQELVRPLLAVSKQVLLAWLTQENLTYRQDASNWSRTYLRNRVRLDLLPYLISRYNPRLPVAVWRLMHLAQEEERLWAAETASYLQRVAQFRTPDLLALNLTEWRQTSPALQKRLLRHALGLFCRDQDVTSAQTQALLDLAKTTKSGGRLIFQACQVARAGPELHFFRLPLPPSPGALILPFPSPQARVSVDSPEGWRWHLAYFPRPHNQPPPPGPWQVWVDADRLDPPLKIRPPQTGDRFWPLGSPGPKKLQDFLVDSKIPRWLRPLLPLLTDASQIIWLPGLRISHPVKISPTTRQVLEITLQPAHPDTARLLQLFQEINYNRLKAEV